MVNTVEKRGGEGRVGDRGVEHGVGRREGRRGYGVGNRVVMRRVWGGGSIREGDGEGRRGNERRMGRRRVQEEDDKGKGWVGGGD